MPSSASAPGSPQEHTPPLSSPSSSPSPPLSPTSLVSPAALPIPGLAAQIEDQNAPKKKSHAKKQPAGHVPRPRNAFIMFRCDFVSQKKVPKEVENNHRNISRIAGQVWRGLTPDERRPWVDLAAAAKVEHDRHYPQYKFFPKGRKRAKTARRRRLSTAMDRHVSEELVERMVEETESGEDGESGGLREHYAIDGSFYPPPMITPGIPHRRSSSCPPPNSIPVLHAECEPNFAYYQSNDDLAGRRPSKFTNYRTAPKYYTGTRGPGLPSDDAWGDFSQHAIRWDDAQALYNPSSATGLDIGNLSITPDTSLFQNADPFSGPLKTSSPLAQAIPPTSSASWAGVYGPQEQEGASYPSVDPAWMYTQHMPQADLDGGPMRAETSYGGEDWRQVGRSGAWSPLDSFHDDNSPSMSS